MRGKRFIVFWLLSCCVLALWGEETLLVGDVMTEQGEAIANASVYFQGTHVGTATDAEGQFVLRADLTRRRVLVVSAVGYLPERFPVEPGAMAGVQVTLRERSAMLEEVLAMPGENPAPALIEAVRQHRSENDRHAIGLQVEAKPVCELYVSGITRRHLQRRLWRGLEAGMLADTDSTWLLPLYSSERGAIILTETDYAALLGDDSDLNFYDTHVSLMGVGFLSPLARQGATYYRYYLADSISTEKGKSYVVDFKTKNPFYATFDGFLWIDSATYAIDALVAEVPEQTNVNFLRGARIRQVFANNHALADEMIEIVMDFAVKIDHSQTFPTVLVRKRLRNRSAELARPVWDDTIQSVPMSQPIEPIAAMQTLDSLPLIRTAKWLATIINTGYIPTGTPVDIGHVQEILQVNRTEGVHIGLPFRTNERLMRNVSLEAAVGYGFRTQQLTGLGRVSALLPARRRHLLVAEYQDHWVWPEVSDMSRLMYENSVGYHTMDFTSYALEALYSNPQARSTLTRQRQFELRTENDWAENVETQMYLRVGAFGNESKTAESVGFRYQSLGGIVRLGWHERKVDIWMRRYHVHSAFPVVYAGLEVGSWEGIKTASSYRMYSKLSLMMRQEANLGLGGMLDYLLSTGATLGDVPPLLLHHYEGNQGYAFDPYRFTLMNNSQYIGRYYLSLHAAWDGRGILLNLIPGVRYLRLHELASFKLAYGDALRIPYVEVGCGLGNILRVLDVHSVWRLTNRDDPTTPLWAMRFRLHIGL